jgi:lysophospholipase L1-like esterase
MKYLPSIVIATVVIVIVGFVIEILIIKYNGSPVAVPEIPRATEKYGSGPALNYAVFGDSTSVGQGGEYDRGIARSTARHLSKNYAVTFTNYGVSGARANDVIQKQLPQALDTPIDVALVLVTANDVTHLTKLSDIKQQLTDTITTLRANNPNVKIVLSGSPQMGSVPRFPDPIKSLARYRVSQVNTMVKQLCVDQNVTFAPVADRTGKIFLDNPQYFAQDKFHPTTEGYDIWTPVIIEALDTALGS